MKKLKNEVLPTKVPGEEIVVIDAWSPIYDIYYFDMMGDADAKFNLPAGTIMQILIKNHCLIIDNRYFVLLLSEAQKLGREKLRTYLNVEFYGLDTKSYVIFQLKRGNVPHELEKLKIEMPDVTESILRTAIKEAESSILVDYTPRPLKRRLLAGQLVNKLEKALHAAQ